MNGHVTFLSENLRLETLVFIILLYKIELICMRTYINNNSYQNIKSSMCITDY